MMALRPLQNTPSRGYFFDLPKKPNNPPRRAPGDCPFAGPPPDDFRRPVIASSSSKSPGKQQSPGQHQLWDDLVA